MCLTWVTVSKAAVILAQGIQAESLQFIFVTQWGRLNMTWNPCGYLFFLLKFLFTFGMKLTLLMQFYTNINKKKQNSVNIHVLIPSLIFFILIQGLL